MKIKLKTKTKDKVTLPETQGDFNTADKVQKEVEEMGFPAFTKPEDSDNTYNASLVDMESHMLGEMYAKYTAMTAFAGSMVAAAKNQLLDVQDEFDNIAAALHIEGSDEKVHISKAKANVTPQYQAARFKVRVAEQKLNLLESSFENYERCANAISREITRRSNDMPFMKRGENI